MMASRRSNVQALAKNMPALSAARAVGLATRQSDSFSPVHGLRIFAFVQSEIDEEYSAPRLGSREDELRQLSILEAAASVSSQA